MIGVSKNFAATTPFVAYGAFASPDNALTTGPAGGLTSNSVTINAVGGDEPYSYQWLKLSGDDVSISSETSNIVYFSASGSNGTEKFASYRCTVTDDSLNELEVDVSTAFFFGTIL